MNAGGIVNEEFPGAFSDFEPGSQIAGYRLVEQIGRGGMAVVYRARDTRLDRWVALKILAPDLARDQVFRQRFIRESRAAAAVDHPNIIPIFDAGEAGGVLYIAMRYVGGQDVRSLLDRFGALPAGRAAGIVAQVASALDAAHACGLVHRDVKPANMLLNDPAERGAADHVYLSDFGVSKRSETTSSLTQTGQLVGTLNYLSPEQIEGRPVDARTDVYALACTAFEMLSGTPPFKRDQSMAVLWAQLSADPPALTRRRPDLPPAIDHVIAKALAKAPADRYGTCLGFASALQAACGLGAGGLAGSSADQTRPLRGAIAVNLPPAAPGGASRSSPPAADPLAAPPRPTTPGLAGPPASPASPPELPRAHRQSQRRSRPRWAVAAVCITLVLLAGGAVMALRNSNLFDGSATISRTPGASTSTAGVISAADSPATTVQKYFSAINSHEYARAWLLGGDNSGSTFPGFVRGFSTTQRDRLTILSVSGHLVRARIAALQTDGTVQTYQGTYTVNHRVITGFDIRRVS
jgi:serine/threonine protein kinase